MSENNNFQKGQKVMVLEPRIKYHRKILTVDSHPDCHSPIRFKEIDGMLYKTQVVICDEEENVELNLKSIQPSLSFYSGD